MKRKHPEYSPDLPAIAYMDSLPRSVKRKIAEQADKLHSVEEVIQFAQNALHDRV